MWNLFGPCLHLSGELVCQQPLPNLLLCCCSEEVRQWGKRGLSPPREEDRKLPLHKLFENLQEFEQTVAASVCIRLFTKLMLVLRVGSFCAMLQHCAVS